MVKHCQLHCIDMSVHAVHAAGGTHEEEHIHA